VRQFLGKAALVAVTPHTAVVAAAATAAAEKAAAEKAAADKAVAEKVAAEKEVADKTAAVGAAVEEAAAKPDAAVTTVATAAVESRVLTEVTDQQGRKVQILDAPIPADCYPEQHADYAGDGVVWGLGHKKASAAECCAACKVHQQENTNQPCNVWVWCGDPSGICWTMDIHNHTTGDCWLKHQQTWDNNPDLKTTNLVVNHRGKFGADFRITHKTSPEFVPWWAGLVPIKPKAARRRSLRRLV
ncbi:hypothetical protein TSOC_008576, partial [Tetrabaena socialis]